MKKHLSIAALGLLVVLAAAFATPKQQAHSAAPLIPLASCCDPDPPPLCAPRDCPCLCQFYPDTCDQVCNLPRKPQTKSLPAKPERKK